MTLQRLPKLIDNNYDHGCTPSRGGGGQGPRAGAAMEVGATFFLSICTQHRLDKSAAAAKKKRGCCCCCAWIVSHIHLTTQEVIFSVSALLDWTSDFAYVYDVYVWLGRWGAGYTPSTAQIVVCHLALQPRGQCAANGTSWGWQLDGEHFNTTAGGGAISCNNGTQITAALMDTCAAPRTVDVPGWIVALLVFGACAGAVFDVLKSLLAHGRVRKEMEER